MATKKQRSKRAKTFRHDYALVMNDEEGNEVEISSVELRGDKKPDAAAKSTSKAPPASRRPAPPPPSWNRALRRGGLMGLGLAVLMVFLVKAPPLLALIYGVLFVPLTYYMDALTFKWWKKRESSGSSASSARKGR